MKKSRSNGIGTPYVVGSPHWQPKFLVWLALGLTLACTCLASKVLYLETFEKHPGWVRGGEGGGTMIISNQQAVLMYTRRQPMDTDHIALSWTSFAAPNWPVRFQEGKTIEMRMDMVQYNHDYAYAGLGVWDMNSSQGYCLWVGPKEVTLFKAGYVEGVFFRAHFFWDQVNLPTADLVVSMAFTRIDSDLVIDIRVLSAGEQTVIWKKQIVDTSSKDAAVPDRAVRGILTTSEEIARPFVGTSLAPLVGIWYGDTTTPPESILATVDNVQIQEWGAASASIASAVCLSWPEDTMEGQIAIGANSLASNAVWTPWPEPIFKANGKMCMATATTAKEQYFRLVPGVQFVDDFSEPTQPFAMRNQWAPFFLNAGDSSRFTFTIVNGVFQISAPVQPLDGQVMVYCPGDGAIVRDFCASVDILDWGVGTQTSALGIAGRVQGDSSRGVSNAYLGSMRVNAEGQQGKGGLYFFDGSSDVPPAELFDLESGSDYRLQFSVVGKQLSLRLLKLTDGQPEMKQERRIQRTLLANGRVGLWVNARGSTGYTRTVDNFCVTGTKP